MDGSKQSRKAAKAKEIVPCPCPCADCSVDGDADQVGVQCLHVVYLCGHSTPPHELVADADICEGEEPSTGNSSAIQRQGWILKKGGGTSGIFSRKNWKRRWFTFDGLYVKYYDKQIQFFQGDHKALGWLKLSSTCRITPHPTDETSFNIETPVRTYFLIAESPKDAFNWVSILTDAINKLEL
eukprot:m.343418 g.343418  ORF g.343418 m.343418 type:complete len:183 (-) comp22803_c0_seq1:31-579(-)